MQILKEFLGFLAILFIRALAKLPTPFLFVFLRPLLPLYCLLRWRHISKLLTLWRASPFEINLRDYYQQRLSLLIHTLKHINASGLPGGSEIENADYLSQAIATKKPILILGLHQGPFEWQHVAPAQILHGAQVPFNLVTAPAFSQSLTRYMTRKRAQKGTRIVINSNLTTYLPGILKNNQALAIMADQSPKREKETLTLWGNIETPVNMQILQIFLKKGGGIMPISSTLKTHHHVRLKFHPLLLPQNEGTPNFTQSSVKQFLQNFLETSISANPIQWNWSYPGIRVN